MGRMPATALLSCLLLGVLACAARPAQAARPSVSYSTWIVSGDTVMLRFVLPIEQAERLTGAAIPVLTVSKLGQYVLEHTAVSASGRECPAIDQGYDLGRVDPVRAGAGLYGFEIFFRCGAPMRSLVLEDRALFERVPGHVNFARIEAGPRFTDQLFTSGRERVRVPDPAAVPAAAFGAYVRLGIRHLSTDAGRLCFLLAALLALRGRRRPLVIIGGLALGYALALALVAFGLIVPEPPMIEAFIGFLVALCALAALAPQLGRSSLAVAGWPLMLLALALIAAGLRAPRPALALAGAAAISAGYLAAMGPAARRAITTLPALMFGFLDGFALPSVLAPLGLDAWSRTRMTIGHDVGSLLAAAGVLALLVGAQSLAGRLVQGRSAGHPAAAYGAPTSLAAVLAGAIFAGLGTFWLVSRL